MITSKYIQINDWCLIEYIYQIGDSSLVLNQTAQKTYRIDNNISNEYSFTGAGLTSEGNKIANDLNSTAVPVNARKSIWAWAKPDPTNNKDIWNYPYDENDEFKNIHGNITYVNQDEVRNPRIPTNMNAIHYDKIRIHILTGYNLDGLDGFVLEPVFKECSGRNFAASSYFYSKQLTGKTIIRNVSPILMSQKSYDKYIEFYVPSLHYINDEYWGTSADDDSVDSLDNYASEEAMPAYKKDSTTFAYTYSHPMPILEKKSKIGAAYVSKSPIYFNLYELSDHFTKNGVQFYYVKNSFTASIKATDAYVSLGCMIKESDEGDYFEYYPTWENSFLHDYISSLNRNANWAVFNKIEVNELVDNKAIKTSAFTECQTIEEFNFDEPSVFRPIIKYSSRAVAAEIMYTMSLMNTNSGEMINRSSSVMISYDNISKYGKSLKRIDVGEETRTFNVYNKVINASVNFDYNENRYDYLIEKLNGKNTASIVKEPSVATSMMYVDKYNICMNSDANRVIAPGVQYYGQNQLTIFLSTFDNEFYFSMYSIDGYEFFKADLSNKKGKLFLVFNLDNNNKKEFECSFVSNNNGDTSATGEFTALVDKVNAAIILNQTKDKNFYIVEKSNNKEIPIYVGKWDNMANKSNAIYKVNESLIEWIVAREKALTEYSDALDDRNAKLEILREEINTRIAQYNKDVDILNSKIANMSDKDKADFVGIERLGNVTIASNAGAQVEDNIEDAQNSLSNKPTSDDTNQNPTINPPVENPGNSNCN